MRWTDRVGELAAADLLVDGDGHSLTGRCGHCARTVDNHDGCHRVTSIMRGGAGVECTLRGDIQSWQAAPLGVRA